MINLLTPPSILLVNHPWQTFLGAATNLANLFGGQRPIFFTLTTSFHLFFLLVFRGCQPIKKLLVEKYI
jgi:hypothetical protein